MELTKDSKSEMQKFTEKFKGKKYFVQANALGQIIKIKATDEDIIAYAQQLGLG